MAYIGLETSSTPKGNPWIEVGATGTLSVVGYNPIGQITFSATPPNVVSISGTTLAALGFGMTSISVTDSGTNNSPAQPLSLYIGSVIIVGADGNSWRMYSDGSVTGPLTPSNISKRMQMLEAKNILFAEVGDTKIYDATPSPMEYSISDAETSNTAVTCYLLNLQKVTR
jgi:hypothetical protein